MTREQLVSLPPELSLPLLRLDRRVRGLAIVRGLGILVVVCVLTLFVALLLDWSMELPVGVRLGMLIGAGVLAAVVIVWWVLRPLLRTTRPEEIAALVEASQPDFRERLTSTVELLRPDLPDEYKGSRLMRDLLMRQTIESMRTANVVDAADGRRAYRAGWIAVAALAFLLVPLLVSPSGYRLLLTRFFMPWGNHERLSNLYFVVDQGDRTVARGSDVEILAEARWRYGEPDQALPPDVWLNWKTENGAIDQRRMLRDDERGVFRATLPHVFQPFDFFITAEDARTRDYHVNVVEAPAISTVGLEVRPPAYTGLPLRQVDGAVGETSVFERSTLRMTLQFNKPVRTAELLWLETADRLGGPGLVDAPGAPLTPRAVRPLELSTDGTSAGVTFEATEENSGPFTLRIVDEYGLENAGEPHRSLRLVSDGAPTIEFLGSNRNPPARADDVFRIAIHASDDVGLDRITLFYELIRQGTLGQQEVERGLLGVTHVDYGFQLDLKGLAEQTGSGLPLRDGDRVRFYAEAADERPVPHPNVSRTEDRMLTIRDDAPPSGIDAVEDSREQWRQLLADIIESLERNRLRVINIRQDAEAGLKQQLEFEHNDTIAVLAADERDQATRLKQLAALFAGSPLYGNLRQRALDVANEELERAPAALEVAAVVELSAKPESLQVGVNELDEALRKLKEMQGQLEEIAALERDLAEVQRLADRAQRLAEDAVSLESRREQAAEQASTQTPEQVQQRQEQLEESRQTLVQEHQKLMSDLENLIDRRPEIVDAAREKQFDRLRELAEQALQLADPQEKLAEAFAKEADLQANDLQPLAERQQELIREARELAAELDRNQSRQLVQPLNLGELKEALEELRRGNAEAAAQHQEQAASEMERLKAELGKNDLLANDPQQAVRQLAEREEGLRQEIEQAVNENRELNEVLKQNPEDEAARQRLNENRQRRRELAAAQTAIQAAAANLSVPRNDRNKQREAVKRAFETVEELLSEKPDGAIDDARRTRETLEQLANDIGDEAQRREEAVGEVRGLRQHQESLARESESIRKHAREGQSQDEIRKRTEDAARKQMELTRKLSEIDPVDERGFKEAALARAAEAVADLQQGALEDAPATQRQAAQALADLEQALQDEAIAAERLAAATREHAEIAAASRAALEGEDADQLRKQAERQRELAKQLGEMNAPAGRNEQKSTRQELEQAAKALEEAAGDPANSERQQKAQRQLDEAEASLEQLANAVSPAELPVQDLAQQLAAAQAEAAQAAQRSAEASGIPESREAMQAAAEARHRAQALEQLRAGANAQQQKREAVAALEEAAAAQARVDELTQKAGPPAEGEDRPEPSAELAEAVQTNAVAQRQAADAVEQLQRQLAAGNQAPPEGIAPAEENLAQALESDAEPLEALAQDAAALAERQAELQKRTQEVARQQAAAAEAEAAGGEPVADQPTREELQQAANELRREQQELNREISRLSREAAAIPRARAEQSGRQADQQLGRRQVAEAAESQQAATDALEDLAAAAAQQSATSRAAAQNTARQMLEQPRPLARGEPMGDAEAAAGAADGEALVGDEGRPEVGSPEQANAMSEQLAARAQQLAEAQRQLAADVRAAQQARMNAAADQEEAPNGREARSEQVAEAIKAQQQLAQEAAELAVEAAAETGPESPQTRSALQFAQEATQAARQATGGRLQEAADLANRAAATGEEAAGQMQDAPANSPERQLGQRTAQLAERQQAAANALSQLAQTPGTRLAAQQEAQQQMEAQAGEIANQLGDVSRQLTSQPIEQVEQGEQVAAAEEAARRGSEEIRESANQLAQGNPLPAGEAARQAARQLRSAAEQALQAAGETRPSSPIPAEVGGQLTEALQQLAQAGEQIAQPLPAAGELARGEGMQPMEQEGAADGSQRPSEGSTESPSTPMESGEGEPSGEAGEGDPMNGPRSGDPGQGQPAGQPGQRRPASESLRQVAQSLSQAAEDLGLSAEQAAQSQSQQAQSNNGRPSQNGESSDNGAREALRLTDLEIQLRNISSQNWGELQGRLETNLIDSAQQRSTGDYGRVVKRYFEEVSRTRRSTMTAPE